MKTMGNILLAVIFLFFVGCEGEAPKPTKVPIPPAGQKPAATAPAKELPRPVVEAKVESPPTVTFTYNPQGKPNPFQPLVVDRSEVPVAKKKVEQAEKTGPGAGGTPLEKMELASLKLVALVWNIPKPRAMVEDPGGKGYILTVGTKIGKNSGQVSKIDPVGVVISEKYEIEGKLKTREVPLRLHADY